MTTVTVVVLGLAAFVTSALSATIGMAGGIVLLSVMTFFLNLAVLVPIHGLVQLASNTTRTLKLRGHIVRPIVFPVVIGLCAGTYVATQIISSIEHREVFYLLIAALIFYTIFKPQRLPNLVIPYWAFGLLGFAVGVLSPLIGATGPLTAPFFLRDDFTKEQIVATKAFTQTIGHLLKIPAFLYLGFDYSKYLGLTLIMICGVVGGTYFGVGLLKKIDEQTFRTIFKIALFVAACRVTYKAMQQLFL